MKLKGRIRNYSGRTFPERPRWNRLRIEIEVFTGGDLEKHEALYSALREISGMRSVVLLDLETEQ